MEGVQHPGNLLSPKQRKKKEQQRQELKGARVKSWKRWELPDFPGKGSLSPLTGVGWKQASRKKQKNEHSTAEGLRHYLHDIQCLLGSCLKEAETRNITTSLAYTAE